MIKLKEINKIKVNKNYIELLFSDSSSIEYNKIYITDNQKCKEEKKNIFITDTALVFGNININIKRGE